jgi:hypothetical protein
MARRLGDGGGGGQEWSGCRCEEEFNLWALPTPSKATRARITLANVSPSGPITVEKRESAYL